MTRALLATVAVLAMLAIAGSASAHTAPVAGSTVASDVLLAADAVQPTPSPTAAPSVEPSAAPTAVATPTPAPSARATTVTATPTPAPKVLADHAYSAPSWTSTYSACLSYAYTGQRVTDSTGTLWIGVTCGWVPNSSRPAGVPMPPTVASAPRTN